MIFGQSKTTLYLLGIVMLIVGVFVASRYFEKVQSEEGEEEQNIFKGITDDSVDRIEISFTDTKHTLRKKDGQWNVESQNFPADGDLISSIFDTLKDARITATASEKPDKASQFEVDEQNGTKVTMFQGEEEKTSFIAGKNGPDFSSSYIKLKERDPIFLVSGDITSAVKITDFRRTKFLNIASNDVERISIIFPDQQFTLVKKDEKWTVEGDEGKALNQGATESFVDTLVALRADEIPAQESENRGFEQPNFEAKFFGPGVDETIIFGKKEGENFFTKNRENLVFLLSTANAESVMKKLSDLEEVVAE